MSGHVTAEQIGQYRAKSLPPGELPAVDRHLAHCEECRSRLADDAEVSKLLNGLAAIAKAPEHLSYDQMADYVDQKSADPDREIVESHAEICARCEAELTALAAFAQSMAASHAAEPAPLLSQAPGLGAISVSKKDLGTNVLAKSGHETKDR